MPDRWPRIVVVCCALLLALAPVLVRAEDDEREAPPERLPRERFIEMQQAIGASAPQTSQLNAVASPSILTWSELGPRPISYDYWSTGPASGRVSSIAVDPGNANTAYLAAAQGGVWKTTDGGTSWTPLTDGISSLSSGALALDPANASVVWYGTGELHDSIDSFYGDGLFRSANGGASWTKIATRDAVGAYIARVAVNLANSSVLYVAGSLGVVRSADGGATWTATLNADWCYDLVQDAGNANVLYAALYGHGVYKTTDGGVTWTRLSGGLPAISTSYQRINLAISRSNPLVLYASYVNPSGGLYAMYKTLDGGTTWTPLPSTPNYLGSQGWYDNCLAVHPTNPSICYAGGQFPYGPGNYGVIKSTNGGATWNDVTYGVDGLAVHPDEHILVFGPDARLWLGNDGGCWTTSDGGLHWINRNNGLGITQFYHAAVHPTNANRILGGTQDNGTPIYTGLSVWDQVAAGDGGYCLFMWNDPATYFTTYVRLNPVYKFNAGGFVAEVTGPWAGRDRASFALGPLAEDRNTPNTLLAGTYRIWRSSNQGASWDSLSNDIAGGSEVVRSIAVANGAPNTIYAGTTSGLMWYTSDGAIWNLRNGGLPHVPINDVSIHPANADIAYCSTDYPSGPKIWKTVNQGNLWTDVSGDLPVSVRGLCLAADFSTTPPILYLGTDYGVYSSIDDGAHWSQEGGGGLPSLAVYDLELLPGGGGVVAATHGRGMWKGTASLVAVAGRGATIEAPALAAPSPTRAPAHIDFRLPVAGPATLEVFDLSGRRLRVLAHGVLAAGGHHATWDGRDERGAAARDGVYFCRLTAPGGARVVKLALLK